MKSIPGKFALLTGACGAALLVACGGGGADSAHGTLGVYLTDAPACGYDNVYVTVDNVRVHRSESAEDGDSGWIDIPVELADPKVDLLELTNGVLAKLGDVSLPAGTYNQVRLVLKGDAGANSVVPTGGSETALVTPSGLQSGLKLNGNFTIEEGATTELALDFDACKSVVKRGNSGSYGLKPVITMVVMSSGGGATSGAISGAVDAAVLSANPVVSAQVGGAIIKSTVPNADGTFSLSPLAEGTYTVVVTSDAHASDVIAGVPVTASGNTAISSTTAPLSLQASAFNTLSGTVSPATSEAVVSAKQTFAAGTVATIKYQNIDVVTGDYSMNLPVAAPRFGQYGTGTLPIARTAVSALAGRYTVEASASGYQQQDAELNMSGGAQTQDFTLAP